jgi:hypothetical protein
MAMAGEEFSGVAAGVAAGPLVTTTSVAGLLCLEQPEETRANEKRSVIMIVFLMAATCDNGNREGYYLFQNAAESIDGNWSWMEARLLCRWRAKERAVRAVCSESRPAR